MALKDWKKTDTNLHRNPRYRWEKEINKSGIGNYRYILELLHWINTELEFSVKITSINRNLPSVNSYVNTSPSTQKNFKSESQALKFAKSYMRTH